ncbi:MAG: glycine cleavage system aminomethyltransferase GcvT [Pseudomonadota bacterium]|nr:glycine cleavage system aminomethyltransferase GcvT [Pseudomonadota bacterium]
MGNRTALYEAHVALGAKMVDFGGWDMPLHYGSQINEHHQVRKAAGVFDVSHMAVVDVEGGEAETFLRRLLANDVARLRLPGKALYSCMLNAQGGVADDLIVYFRGAGRYRLVVNAATRDTDLSWMAEHAEGFEVKLTPRDELAMLAVQGPQAVGRLMQVLPPEICSRASELEPFFSLEADDLFISRTGYTGEDGFEIILPADGSKALWERLLSAGYAPCGLGARDTLRLEAGMNLYGCDMDQKTTPLESGLAWTIAWDPETRDFIGRSALERSARTLKQVGLILEGRGVLRSHQRVVVPDIGDGEITSGTYSPTLKRAIALARVPVETGHRCLVEMRGKLLPARVVKPPFVRHGKIRVAWDS